jgi:hypothetical protein
VRAAHRERPPARTDEPVARVVDDEVTAEDDAAWAPMKERSLAEHTGGEVPYRAEMEHAFGADFSGVRAHVDAGAPLASMGAVAAARGDEVAFASASPGRHEVAHELTHVVQQRQAGSATVAHLGSIEGADTAAEREADGVAHAVAAGGPAPAIRAVPTGRIARMIDGLYEPADPEVVKPRPLVGATAAGWLDANRDVLGFVVAAHLGGARLPAGHPRLTWSTGPAAVAQDVWAAIAATTSGFGDRLMRLVSPFELAAQVDAMRTIDEANSTDGTRRGPTGFVTEIAVMIAREVERSLAASTARLGPRLVAAVDAVPDLEHQATCGPRDGSTVLPAALVTSHPVDVLVAHSLCVAGTSTIAPREPDADEPAFDRMAAAGPGGLRPVQYRWVDDPALWNWVKVEPTDATPEEVSLALIGETSRASELRASAPFFAIPPDVVQRLEPSRNNPAVEKVTHEKHPFRFLSALNELSTGTTEDALAGTATGEEAGLAQAARLEQEATASDGNASALADRCSGQVEVLVDRFATFGAEGKLAAMKARLAARRERLPSLTADEYRRFSALFEQQSALLYDLAGDLQPLSEQARRIQQAEAMRAAGTPGSVPPPAVDPAIQSLADGFLDAGSVADLPETARARLAAARDRQGAASFDAFDAMLGDARERTLSTLPIAGESGPGDAPAMKDGLDVALDLRARQEALSGDVLAGRRAQAAGTASADDAKVLGERVRALHVESRLVSAMTQCMYMADQLDGELGLIALVSFQYGDLTSARNTLRGLCNGMSRVLYQWRERHAELFAALDAGVCQAPDPAAAARAAIAELDTELAQLGDDKVHKALSVASDELHDMAIAKMVVDIAIMVGLTLVTSGLGGMAAGAARGLRMGRLVVALADISTQSIAMAGLRTAIWGDSFADAIGTELLTNLAGFGALRGLAHALPTAKLGKALAALKQSGGAWKYAAHGAELSMEAATQAGIQFAIAQGESLIRNGRALNDDELKMLAIQGMGMFIGNAVAHRLAAPVLDHLSAYAARVGRPYRRAEVRALAEHVGASGDPETTKALLREERAMLEEERGLYEQLGNDKAEVDAIGYHTLRELKDQNRAHRGEITGITVEHALQQGLTETAPGMAWEGSASQVEPVLADARAAGAAVTTEVRPDGERIHDITAGDKRYTVREPAPQRVLPDVDPKMEALAAARATVEALEVLPGSGVKQPPTTASAQILAEARGAAADPTSSTQVLDALRDRLPPEAQKGLTALRDRLRDDGALRAIEAEAKAQDLTRFLIEKGMTTDEVRAFGREVFQARAAAARAHLDALGIPQDGNLQTRVSLDASNLANVLRASGDVSSAKLDGAVEKANVTEIIADLGEAIARKQLRSEHASVASREVISNVELVGEVTGFSTIKQWQAAQRSAHKADEPKGLYEADGQVWKSITEVDNMVVERLPGDKLRPVVLEQVKSGTDSASYADAVAQNTKAMTALQDISSSTPGIEIYDRVGKNTLGARRTADFDLGDLGSVQSRATGLPGKEFGTKADTAVLDLGTPNLDAKDARAILTGIARDLLGDEAARQLAVMPPPGETR